MNPKLIALKIAKLLNDNYELLNFIVVERHHQQCHQYYVIQKNVYTHIMSMRRLGNLALTHGADYVVNEIGKISKARNEEFITANEDYLFSMNEIEELLYG